MALLTGSIAANAQVLPWVQEAFDAYQKDRYQEKIFVHTDKDTYLAGELIWYKVYCRNSLFKAVDFSRVVYVDVLDEQNNFLLQAKVALDKGSGSGSFYLPKTFKSGAFKLRAYTNWLKNFGVAAFFEKKLNLINLYGAQEEVLSKPERYDIQFFPEGGSLVEGLDSRVAFKAVGADGKGRDLSGVVVNEKNDTVARFSTLKFGMGSFAFKPLKGHSYKAIAKSVQQAIVIKELPSAKQNGFVMNVAQVGNGIKIKLNTNTTASTAFLLIQHGQQLTLAQQVVFSEGESNVTLDHAQLKDGVSSFTLFSKEGLPLAERLFFKRPSVQLQLSTTFNSKIYSKRNKVDLEFDLHDRKGKAGQGDFSMAVYQLDSLNQMPAQDIVSYLWLVSALKGNIESASYYFENDNSGANEALDNLLLSQGWRNFTWKEVLEGQKPVLKFLPELNGHIINGQIVDPTGKIPANKGLYVGILGKKQQFYGAKSNTAGNFMVNTRDFFGAKELAILPQKEADSSLQIKLWSPFAEQFNAWDYRFDAPTLNHLNALRQRNMAIEAQQRFNAKQWKVFYSPTVDSSIFYGKPSKQYDLDLYTRFPTMEETIREFIAEVRMTKHQKQSHFKVIGEEEFLEEDPLVLLDGVPYNDMDMVMAFDPAKIKSFAVVKERYVYGGLVMEGIIDLTTIKGDLAGEKIDPHTLVLDYEGLELQREFYQPVYESEAQLKSRIPDFRNVLYWTPNLLFDVQGKAKASFFTSDQIGNYVGVIQGISENGIPISSYFNFVVK